MQQRIAINYIPVLFLQSPLNGETYDEYFMERVNEIESEKIEIKEKVEILQEKGDYVDYLKRAEDLLLEKGKGRPGQAQPGQARAGLAWPGLGRPGLARAGLARPG